MARVVQTVLQEHHWLLVTALWLTDLACLEPEDAIDILVFGLVKVLFNCIAMALADAKERLVTISVRRSRTLRSKPEEARHIFCYLI